MQARYIWLMGIAWVIMLAGCSPKVSKVMIEDKPKDGPINPYDVRLEVFHEGWVWLDLWTLSPSQEYEIDYVLYVENKPITDYGLYRVEARSNAVLYTQITHKPLDRRVVITTPNTGYGIVDFWVYYENRLIWHEQMCMFIVDEATKKGYSHGFK